MKPVKFHPEAELETQYHADYYEGERPGLGKRFLSELQATVQRIRINPKIYKKATDDTRRCPTKIFPFWVMFREKKSVIEIIAIAHFRKEPGYWKDRA